MICSYVCARDYDCVENGSDNIQSSSRESQRWKDVVYYTTRWGIITGPPSAKWQNYFVTVLFFGIKIPTTKHEIMLHAMSLKGGSRMSKNCNRVSWQLGTNWISALLIQQSGSGARVFVRVLKRKADTLNTNW